MEQQIVHTAIGMIAIPWTIWVTVSLFNQRQELALLKQIFEMMREKCISMHEK